MKTLLSPDEAADYLGLTISCLSKWRHYGTGPVYIKVGPRIVRYELADLDKFLNSNKQRP